MKLTRRLMRCPSQFKIKILNKYFNDCHPIFENILFNLNLSSTPKKNYDYSDATEPNIDKIYQVRDIVNYTKQNRKTIFKPFTDCRFISNEIMWNILTKHTVVEDIYSSYKTNNIKLRLYNNYESDDYKKNCFSQKIEIAIKMTKIFTMLELLNIKNKTIDIYYAPVNIPKTLPIDNHFGIDEINSGGTIHDYSKSFIVLFRQEESDKVLIHELIHYLRLDFSTTEVYYKNAFLISKSVIEDFNVNHDYSKINLFEGLTDSLGIIFNSIFNCILTKSNIDDYFYTEYCYCLTVAEKIIKHAGFKDINDLMDKDNNLVLHQSTSVLSYYILKCSLLNNADLILTEYFPKFNTEWNLRDIDNFYGLAKKDLLLIKKIISNPNIKNSLRMTYNDLKY